MKTPSRRSRKPPTRSPSAAARQRASQRQAKRRKRAQRQRQVANLWQRLGTLLAGVGRLLPNMVWRRPHLRTLRGTGVRPGKLASLLLLAAVVGGLYWTVTDDAFFVYAEDVHFTGLTYLGPQELYERCNWEGWSVFWIQPEEIRQCILENPYTTDAQVQVQFPGQVKIAVTEARPVAIWMTGQSERWLLQDGRALPMRSASAPGLPRIVDLAAEATALGQSPGSAMDPDLLQAALYLAGHLPGLGTIRYNKGPGLNFGLPNTNYWVYWGEGQDFDTKMRDVQILQEQMQHDGKENKVLDVRLPAHPYVHGP
jgi:hypothetical protein